MIGSGNYMLPATLGAFGSISIFGWALAAAPIAAAATGYLSYFFPQIANAAPGSTVATLAMLWQFVAANVIDPRLAARIGGGLFSCGMIVVTEAELLIWSAAARVLAVVAYWGLRVSLACRMLRNSNTGAG
jgi:hypothetical protein